MSHPQRELSIGERVDLPAARRPERTTLEGTVVALRPLEASRDAEGLYTVSHGDEDKRRLWTYLFQRPFDSPEQMRSWLEEQEDSSDPLFFSVYDRRRGRPVGMVSFLNIVPEMLRLEVGNIWYTPRVQRTRVNTESVYLMLRYAFEELGYRRVEWKCDALNERSRRAALRLGFQFEGEFRQHMVIKGRNRDTSWYAMLAGDWPTIRSNIERWLDSGASEGRSLGALKVAAFHTSIGKSDAIGPG